ncbi:MAG TPA: hypothetical protein VHA52_11850 [Candidatus Babeliaceae bacterium]|nr:hypothetical protein [Candidatus Babeliaceae bacterium]
MSENTDTANDYALARLLNEREIQIFSLLADHRDIPDTTDINLSYVLLADELKQIYSRQPALEEIGQPICWRVMSNLELFHENIGEYKTLAWEYTNSGADYGEEHNASVTTLCIRANATKPIVPPRIEKLLSDADRNIKAFQYELDKMNATLSIEGFSIPVVTVGETKYRFSSMRDGLVLSIIDHCLSKHPNEQIDFDTLKSELKELDIKVPAKTNIKEQIRTSRFAADQALNPFVTAFPKAIIVRPTVELSNEQIKLIELASV